MKKTIAGEPINWAECAAQAALSKKASGVTAIKVKPTLVIVDYFVVATANNPLQMNAIIDAIEDALRNDYGLKPIGREGLPGGHWVLLDYGDIVVHVFTPETRDFYRLDTLYNDAEIKTYEE
jgi:ribosome-associated protein